MAPLRFLFVAPLLLALVFLGHVFNVLVLEPGLGFSSAQDFYDAGKLLAVIGHPVWKIGSFYHLLAAVAVSMLARELIPGRENPLRPYVSVLGIGAAILFLLVGLTGFVGLRELGTIADLNAADARSVYGAFLIFRTVLLSGAVLLLGGFLLLGNAARLILASTNTGARYVGVAAGTACVLFILVPVVAPAMMLLIIGWGALSAYLAFKRERPSDRRLGPGS